MSFKDSWQNFLTNIDKRLPIKKLTGPLDKKRPLTSFFVFLLIILLVLFFIFGKPLIFSKDKSVEITFKFTNTENEILSNLQFKIKNETTQETETYFSSSNGSFTTSLNLKHDFLLSVDDDDYDFYEKKIDLFEPIMIITLTPQSTQLLTQKTFNFLNSSTSEIIQEPLTVTISCSNKILENSINQINSGKLVLDVPSMCDSFVITVSGDKYNLKNKMVSFSEDVIYLTPERSEQDKGGISVSVIDDSENPIEESITLKLFLEDDLITPLDTKQTNMGAAFFNSVSVGEYVLKANDVSNKYLPAQKNVSVTKNKTSILSLSMQDSSASPIDPDTNQPIEFRDISVILKDKESGENLSEELNAVVSLLLDQNNNIDSKTFSEGFVFKIQKHKNYFLKASADGYIPSEIIPINQNQESYVIFLEEITFSNVSNINVYVVDEDSQPIPGINAWIYDAEGKHINPRFNKAVSDENGLAVFEDIPDLNFTIKVKNQYLEGISSLQKNTPPEDTNLTLSVEIGKGDVSLTVKGFNNALVNNAVVTFYSETLEELGSTHVGLDGTLVYSVKADKKVFLKIEGDGYLPYFTELFRIYKNKTVKKDVVLENEFLGSLPVVDYLGLYNTDDKEVENLKNNEVFYLKFKVNLPLSSDRFSFVFRAGSGEDVSEEHVYILSEDNYLGLVTRYDKEDFTVPGNYPESKLITIAYPKIQASTYEIFIPVKIRNAKVNEKINFYYFASIDTLPQNLMNRELYNELFYFVDATSICNDVFCFKGQYVDVLEDLRYDIDLKHHIPVKINSDYVLEYEIINSKNVSYDDLKFSARNTFNNNPINKIAIKEYSISGELSGYEVSDADKEPMFKIPFYENYLSGSFSEFSKLNFKVDVFPRLIGNSDLTHSFISNQTLIHSFPIKFSSASLNKMEISYTPKNIVMGTSFNLNVLIEDSKNIPLKDAIINIYSLKNGQQNFIKSAKTNSNGIAIFYFPGLRADDMFVITATKTGYEAEDVSFGVNDNILDIKHQDILIKPADPLQVFIHKTDFDGEEYILSFINKTDYSLVINKFSDDSFSFQNSDFINMGKLKNFLNNQLDNFEIPANSSKDLKFKFTVSENARNLSSSKILLGNISGSYILNNKNHIFTIPIKLKISVGEGVFEDDCLIMTGGFDKWSSVVSNNPITQTIEIMNNCLSKETKEPITLKNLQAKIVSQQDRIGSYSINVVGGSNLTSYLVENNYSIFLESVLPNEVYTIEINYLPSGVKSGNVKTDIYLNAQVETENGLVKVNKETKPILKTDFKIANLSECIVYKSENKKINENGLFVLNGIEENDLIIENVCNDIYLEMKLCEAGDPRCKDLTIENTDDEDNTLYFKPGESSKYITLSKSRYKPYGAYILNNKVSLLNEYQKPISSVYLPLRINAIDPNGLWSKDPFIEVNEDGYSEVITLYNNDIENTPWDYVAETHSTIDDLPNKEDSKFIKLLSNNYEKHESDFFKKMKFEELENLDYQTSIKNNPFMPIGGAAGITAVPTFLVILNIINITASKMPVFLSFAFSIPGWGWLALAGFAAFSWIATSWKNEFVYPVLHVKYLNVDPSYLNAGEEKIKFVNINSSNKNNSNLYINIFDITGSRYKRFHNLNTQTQDADKKGNKIKDRLTKNATLELSNYALCTEPGFNLEKSYGNIIKNINCSSNLEIFIDEQSNLSHSVECYGDKPIRNKIQLKTEFKYICKANEKIWPEQAGIKPLQFVFDKEQYQDLKDNSQKYILKSYDLYATMDDSLSYQDPAFLNSPKIGDYRFAFFLTKPKEIPNFDLELADCSTDIGKFGKTGEGALPNISLDWSWNINDINNCSEIYCDATQLTQVVLNRINLAKNLIDDKGVFCPKSEQQLSSENLNGVYYIESANPETYDSEVTFNKIGLNDVIFETDKNMFVAKVYLDNRTQSTQAITINSTLGSNLPKKVYIFDVSEDTYKLLQTRNNVLLPIEPLEDDTTDILFEFYNSDTEPIIGKDLIFNVNLSGNENIDNYAKEFSSTLTLDVYEHNDSDFTDCLVNPTTISYGGINYLDMWINEDMYPDNVTKKWNKEDISKLKSYLEFDAYLITDKYNKNFINDFDRAYGGYASSKDGSSIGSYAIMLSHSVFSEGYLSPLFKNNLYFYKKYTDIDSFNDVDLKVPGKYKIKIDFTFNNSNWNFGDKSNTDVNTFVTMDYVSSPETDSIFYRLPFNNFLGEEKNGGYNRQGYGLSYYGDEIIISHTNNIYLTTQSNTQSNAFRNLHVSKLIDFSNINFKNKGALLKIETNEFKDIYLTYTPNTPIPVMMKISNRSIFNELEATYNFKDKHSNLVKESNLFSWQGVGTGIDFSGNSLVNSVFSDRFYNDRYIIKWYNVSNKLDVYLRNILYIPENENYTLRDMSSNNVNLGFSTTPNKSSSFTSQVSLSGDAKNLSIQDVLNMVKQKKVCVVNSYDGSSVEFYYNASKIYSDSFYHPPS